jgi:hypothetical protein
VFHFFFRRIDDALALFALPINAQVHVTADNQIAWRFHSYADA